MTESSDDNAELVIDLNFVPAWARQPPKESPYSHFDQADRPPRDAGPRTPGGDRRHGPTGDRRGFQRRPSRESGDRDRGRRMDERPAPPRYEFAAPPPIQVDFLPERKGLAPLARRLALSARAYPLFDVAALFLSKPDYYAVKLTAIADGDQPAPSLFQCQECHAVFLDPNQAAAHGFKNHQGQYYRTEQKEAELPKGNFVCVARCGLSGELLGPPNYHGFNEIVMETHRTRYPHLALDEYRRHIETVHSPELLEQWKERMCRQTVYHVADSAEPLTFTRMSEVEAHYEKHHAGTLLREGRRFILSGPDSQRLEDPVIGHLIRDAWNDENRFPLRISITLRLAFRHLGLHLFKTNGGGTFVTSICPNAIDPGTAIPTVKMILERLATDPGCTRAKLIENLTSNTAPGEQDAADLNKQIRWLIDKGHVIEFSNGTLAVPVNSIARVQYPKRAGSQNRQSENPPLRRKSV